MLPKVMSRIEVRRVDERAIAEYGMLGLVLMENAGRGCADWLCELGIQGRVVICCGKGNNGGDGFVIARHLTNRGYSVRTLLFCDPNDLVGDAAANFQILQHAGADLRIVASAPNGDELCAELADCDWIVDALLGTGTTGRLREPYLTAIRAINESGARVLAVDLPSGLDCDLGRPIEDDAPLCVRACYTATFVARKLGFAAPGSVDWTGIVRVIDIGVPHTLFD